MSQETLALELQLARTTQAVQELTRAINELSALTNQLVRAEREAIKEMGGRPSTGSR